MTKESINLLQHCSGAGFNLVIQIKGNERRRTQWIKMNEELKDVALFAIRQHLNIKEEEELELERLEVLKKAFDSQQISKENFEFPTFNQVI